MSRIFLKDLESLPSFRDDKESQADISWRGNGLGNLFPVFFPFFMRLSRNSKGVLDHDNENGKANGDVAKLCRHHWLATENYVLESEHLFLRVDRSIHSQPMSLFYFRCPDWGKNHGEQKSRPYLFITEWKPGAPLHFSRLYFFQIAIKNGMIQNWGLVEFQSSEDAETTLERLDGHDLGGHRIRVQYCVPGVHAINIYMSFINNPLDAMGERKALMEEAPSTKVRA